MLARALGPQKVVVRANVDVETAKVAKTDEIYDPDRVAVVSERKIQEKQKGFGKKNIGAPGTPTNVPATINTGNKNLLLDKNKKDITTNYDVSKSMIKTQQNIFKIKRLSVGVLIDGKYVKMRDKNGTVVTKFVPRSKSEIKAYENLVKSVVGYDPKRGDQVTVVSVPFETVGPQIQMQPQKSEKMQKYILLGAIALLSLVLLGLIFYIVAKVAKSKKALKEAQVLAQMQPTPGSPAQMTEAAKAAAALREAEEEWHIEKEPIYRKILQMASENPQLIADMISKWIKEEGK
jgi:flagellar M-ring protein FliF